MNEVTEHEVSEPEPAPDQGDGTESPPGDAPDAADLPDVTEPLEPQEQPVTPEQAEKAFQKIAQSFRTYERSVANNHPGYEAEVIRCLLCPDAHPGFLNVNDAGRVPKDVSDAVQVFLGFAREISYEPAPDTRTCGTCNGEGKVASGSHVPEHKVRTCPTCNGFGYEPPPGAGRNGHAPLAAPVEMASGAVPPVLPADVDEWGEPRILPDGRANPNFGRMPIHKVAVEPWGITAGLVAQDVK